MFDFGEALKFLRDGKSVQRAGWNGKGMYLVLISNGVAKVPSRILGAPGNDVLLEPFIVMWTAQKNWVPWLASQADVLASDWQVVE